MAIWKKTSPGSFSKLTSFVLGLRAARQSALKLEAACKLCRRKKSIIYSDTVRYEEMRSSHFNIILLFSSSRSSSRCVTSSVRLSARSHVVHAAHFLLPLLHHTAAYQSEKITEFPDDCVLLHKDASNSKRHQLSSSLLSQSPHETCLNACAF